MTVDRSQLEHETDFLNRVARYREQYRNSRAAAVKEERERHHANGEVYFAGSWVPARQADRLAHMLKRREFFAFFEITLLLVIMVAMAWGLCWLFAFLFLPG